MSEGLTNPNSCLLVHSVLYSLLELDLTAECILHENSLMDLC